MAGTIPLSMTQQFDVYGKPLAGGQLYIIQAGTVSTPQNGFQDLGLTIPLPYPIPLDAAGRVPQFFLADGTVKIRLQDKNGVVQLASDSVMVIGASSGGGGGGAPVDQTQLIKTGMMMFAHSIAGIAGFVRLNGKTIGSATSGASERNFADTRDLFLYLWPDTTLTVSGGRTTASGDWDLNKQIALPDWRGYALGALDDMGNTPSGRLTVPFFGVSPIILGAASGAESRTLTAAQCAMPTHDHSVFIYDPQHLHNTPNTSQGGVFSSNGNNAGTPQYYAPGLNTPTNSVPTNITIGPAAGIAGAVGNKTGPASQAAVAHAAIGPRKLCTFYMKL